MNPEDIEKRKKEVDENRGNCNHIGFFVGFGCEVFPLGAALMVVTTTNCAMCGEIFIKTSLVENPVTGSQPDKSEAKKPIIIKN